MPPRPPRSVGGSAGEIQPRKSAEARNENASTTSVTGAVSELHQHAADARPAHVRERAAAVQERFALDEALARDERDEERAVRDVEEDGERPDEERDD